MMVTPGSGRQRRYFAHMTPARALLLVVGIGLFVTAAIVGFSPVSVHNIGGSGRFDCGSAILSKPRAEGDLDGGFGSYLGAEDTNRLCDDARSGRLPVVVICAIGGIAAAVGGLTRRRRDPVPRPA